MAQDIVSAPPRPVSGLSTLRWVIVGATVLACAAVIARVPLWGPTAWGTHVPPDFVGNLPLLLLLGVLLGAYLFWSRESPSPEAETGKRSSGA